MGNSNSNQFNTDQQSTAEQAALEKHIKEQNAKTRRNRWIAVIVIFSIIVLGFGAIGGIYLFKPSIMPSFISNTGDLIDEKTRDFIKRDTVTQMLDDRLPFPIEPWSVDTTPTIALRDAGVTNWPVVTTMVQNPDRPSSIVYRNIGPMVELAYIINLRNNTTANITATSFIHVTLELPIPIASSTLYESVACSTNVHVSAYQQSAGITINKVQTRTRDFKAGTSNKYCTTIYWDIGIGSAAIYDVQLAGTLIYPNAPPPPPAKIATKTSPAEIATKTSKAKQKVISRPITNSSVDDDLPID